MSSAGESAPRIVHFDADELPPGDLRAVLGGKGAGLVEMTRAGFSVPAGFTISVDACARFVASGGEWPSALRQAVRESIGRLEAICGRRFGASDDDVRLLVSVRSGAAVSMPGMMDTVLDCGASEDPWDELFDAIERVFRSFSSARARSYRARHRLDDVRGTAVTIQEMFPAEVAGVLFSVHPSGSCDERMIVESAFGLGEAIVSGAVTPDRFELDRESGECLSILVGDRDEEEPSSEAASLDDERLSILWREASRLEEHYGHAVDVEWAFAGDRLALLQVRPIRGLDVAREVETARRAEIDRLRGLLADQSGRDAKSRVWVRHNLSETLPLPTPLTWDFVRIWMSGDGGFGRLYRRLGYRPSERVLRHGFLELIAGRIFADPERLAELFWDGLPLGYDVEALRADPSTIDRAPTKFQPERADGRFLLLLPRNLWSLLTTSRRMRRRASDVRREFVDESVPEFLSFVEACRAVDLSALSGSELLSELDRRIDRVLVDFGAAALEPGFFGALAFARLEQRLELIFGAERGRELAIELVGGLEGDTTVDQDALLWDVAQGRAALEEFVDRYGHRCAGEMELREPRWRESIELLRPLIESLRSTHDRPSPAELHEANAERRRAAERSLGTLLEENGASSLSEEVERDLAEARELLPFRETGKHWWSMGYALLRDIVEEAAGRFSLGDDVYFFQLAELRAMLESANLREASTERLETANARRVRWEAFGRLAISDLVDTAELSNFGTPTSESSDSEEVTGTPVSPGYARGVVRIVEDPHTAGELCSGYVLVCPSTDPGWTPLFLGASALVIERGGVLSHGAIVARDFGIPAVVWRDATRRWQDGETLEVDGSSGRIVTVSGESVAESANAEESSDA